MRNISDKSCGENQDTHFIFRRLTGLVTSYVETALQIEVARRRGRRRKKLLDDLKDRRGYCQLMEEALDRTVWRNRFGRGFGPVV